MLEWRPLIVSAQINQGADLTPSDLGQRLVVSATTSLCESCFVTGATGVVGLALCRALLGSGASVRAAYRRSDGVPRLPPEVTPVAIRSIGPDSQWKEALNGVDTVLHLAARVHIMKDSAADPLVAFRAMNTLGTENLARQAAAAGVRRFVFVSSVKVNGESTPSDAGFTEADPHRPRDPYGISKSEAELALQRVSRETGLEVVIVRPPLVYGPCVKGNFLSVLKVLRRGLPLPLASVVNRRSLVYLGNLVDALILCARHPAAANQTYLVSDGEDVSTPDLLRRLAQAMGVPARLLPVPEALLRVGGSLAGRSKEMGRLLGSLVVDSSKITRELGWKPPFSLNEGLQRTADWFMGR